MCLYVFFIVELHFFLLFPFLFAVYLGGVGSVGSISLCSSV